MPVVWPFLPNLRRAPYVVSREYRTEILVSRSGQEQARALRQTPRKRIEYVMAQAGDCLRDFDRSMIMAQRQQLAIPDRIRYVVLASTLAGGATAIVIDPIPSWLIEGSTLVLTHGSDHSLRTVASIIGTTVTFIESDTDPWPAGSRLHFGLVGYLASAIPAPVISQRGVIEASVIFEVDPGSEEAEDSGAADFTLGGREVFLKRPDRWAPIDLNRVQEGSAQVDYGMGRIQRFFPIEFSTQVWEGSYTGCDFEHADEFRAFFDRMKGRRGEFYMPTFRADLIPTAGITAAGTTITVEGGALEDFFDDSTVYKALALKKSDGTWITRIVTNVADTSSTVTTITVSAAWGSTVALADIAMVSWMPVWRFASDILTQTWFRDTVAETRMSFQMIETLAVEA